MSFMYVLTFNLLCEVIFILYFIETVLDSVTILVIYRASFKILSSAFQSVVTGSLNL